MDPHREQAERGEADLSTELVRRIQGGDAAAWEALYLRYRDPLLFSIRCRLGSGLRARIASEDVLHSVVADAIRDLNRFQPRGPGSLNHFLHACVLNKIRNKADYFGARVRQNVTHLSDSIVARLSEPANEPPGYIEADLYGRLEEALARLPDEMREVVILRQVEGVSNQQAAEIIRKSPAATSKLHNRALARLGTSLGAAS